MEAFEIALYPGDGIGPDVLEQAVRVMYRVGERYGITFKTKTLNWGYEYWKEHGTVVPEGFLDQIRGVDAILLGAVGWPAAIPDHVTLAPLVQIRQAFDQYACVRPANLFSGLQSVLAAVPSILLIAGFGQPCVPVLKFMFMASTETETVGKPPTDASQL